MYRSQIHVQVDWAFLRFCATSDQCVGRNKEVVRGVRASLLGPGGIMAPYCHGNVLQRCVCPDRLTDRNLVSKYIPQEVSIWLCCWKNDVHLIRAAKTRQQDNAFPPERFTVLYTIRGRQCAVDKPQEGPASEDHRSCMDDLPPGRAQAHNPCAYLPASDTPIPVRLADGRPADTGVALHEGRVPETQYPLTANSSSCECRR